MRTDSFPFLADWIAISLRWLSLLGMTTTLAITTGLTLGPGILLLILALWNVFMSLLAILNKRLPQHRPINVGMDVMVVALLYAVMGGSNGALLWVGIVPLFSAAIYYEWKGSLLIATLFSAMQWISGWLLNGSLLAWPVLAILTGLNLAGGGLFGVLARPLIRSLRGNYQNQVHQRKVNEESIQQQEHNRMQAFFSMIEVLSTTLNYDLVLNTVLDLSQNALGGKASAASELVSAVLMFGGHDLQIAFSRRLSLSDQRQTFAAERGALNRAVEKAEVVLISAPAEDGELSCLMALQGCQAALALPVRRGMNSYGVLLFAHPQVDFFTQERVEVLEMISHQAVIAIQNARLYQDLELEKQHLIDSQEEARKKLARDLHDGPTQSVSNIAMRLSIARKLLESNSTETAGELEKVEELARKTTQEIRHMLFTLRPLTLEAQGLVPALQALADKMRDIFQQNVVIDVDAEAAHAIEDKGAVLFQIVEEAVNNARKHARAEQISVCLHLIPQNNALLLLEINDNGMGFDVQAVNNDYDRRGSLGMVNLRERAALVRGLLHIDSAPGKGTQVHILIPVTELAADRLERGIISPS